MTDAKPACGAVCRAVACDREPGHRGYHRGYLAPVDAPVFWLPTPPPPVSGEEVENYLARVDRFYDDLGLADAGMLRWRSR